MSGLATSNDCQTDNDEGTITVTTFIDDDLSGDEEFTFTIGSIRNPTVTGSSYSINFEILSDTSGVVDLGSFTFDDDLIVSGEIWSFTVEPQDTGVGQYPVAYDFSF